MTTWACCRLTGAGDVTTAAWAEVAEVCVVVAVVAAAACALLASDVVPRAAAAPQGGDRRDVRGLDRRRTTLLQMLFMPVADLELNTAVELCLQKKMCGYRNGTMSPKGGTKDNKTRAFIYRNYLGRPISSKGNHFHCCRMLKLLDDNK